MGQLGDPDAVNRRRNIKKAMHSFVHRFFCRIDLKNREVNGFCHKKEKTCLTSRRGRDKISRLYERAADIDSS